MDDKNLIYLEHILENIKKIKTFTRGISKEDLIKEELKQYAVVRAIEIIGEAAKNISENFKKQNSDIPWKQIIGSRDKVIHHYFGIDLDIIWDIVKNDLPDLEVKINKIIKKGITP